jgi:hypothetical protein
MSGAGPGKKFEIGAFLPEGSKVKKIEVEAPEDPEDKEFRLRKEFWTWVLKDLAAYAASLLFVLIISLYCFSVVARHGVASPEAKLVLPMITTLFGGVVGVVVGRSSK